MKTTEIPNIETLTLPELRVMCAEGDGWTKIELYEDTAWPSGWWGMPPANFVDTFLKEKTHGAKLPNYPEDANAALGLVESLRKEGWDVSITAEHDQITWDCYAYKTTLADGGKALGVGETIPLAICRAYVLAKGLARH